MIIILKKQRKKNWRLFKKIFEKVFENIYYFKNEFLKILPILFTKELENVIEFDNHEDFLQNEIYQLFETNLKKIESDLFNIIIRKISSHINLGFLGLFYSELLDEEVEFFYKERIEEKTYNGILKRKKKYNRRRNKNNSRRGP